MFINYFFVFCRSTTNSIRGILLQWNLFGKCALLALPRTLRSRVYATVVRPSVCLSVRPLVWAWRPGDIDQLLHGQWAGGQQQLRRSTALDSKCGECHAISWRRKLNTNLLIKFHQNNQKVIYFWCFDFYQRPPSVEAGTRSSSGSWRDKLVSSQESGRTYDWVGSSLRPGSWVVDLPSGYELPPNWSIW